MGWKNAKTEMVHDSEILKKKETFGDHYIQFELVRSYKRYRGLGCSDDTHAHPHTHTHTHTPTHTHTNIHTNIHTYTQIHTHIHTHTQIHTHTHTN